MVRCRKTVGDMSARRHSPGLREVLLWRAGEPLGIGANEVGAWPEKQQAMGPNRLNASLRMPEARTSFGFQLFWELAR